MQNVYTPEKKITQKQAMLAWAKDNVGWILTVASVWATYFLRH